jgi:predicted ribosome quality control (RQC) complex YloA/Tae2 family protein
MLIIEDQNGFTYYVGENAKDNWNLLQTVKKLPNGLNWIWFHLDNFSSAYVILCSTMKDAPKNAVTRGAELCKEYGKYKNIARVSVIYTEVKNVKRTEKVGQVTTSKTQKIIV